MAIVFTGDEFGEGGESIIKTLQQQKIKASFFLTGRFYRNLSFVRIIRQLKMNGNYLGPHSDQHLLYCDWNRRDSLLVTKNEFQKDLDNNYEAMQVFGIKRKNARYFLPPYEWYNDSIAAWTNESGLQLINYTPGTLSHTDYTTPDQKNYCTTRQIIQSIINYEKANPAGLNGFILLMHIGSGPVRTDKAYSRLNELISWLKTNHYQPVTITELLSNEPEMQFLPLRR